MKRREITEFNEAFGYPAPKKPTIKANNKLRSKLIIEELCPFPCTIKNLLLPTDIKLALEIFEIEIVSSSLRNSLFESWEKIFFPLRFVKYKKPRRIPMKPSTITILPHTGSSIPIKTPKLIHLEKAKIMPKIFIGVGYRVYRIEFN